jgi:magnesium transporter
LVELYNLKDLLVVSPEGRLMGVILAEDMVDVVEEEATEDMYRMAMLAGERYSTR